LSFLLLFALALMGCSGQSPSGARDGSTVALTLPDVRFPPQLFFFVTTECPISNGYAPEMIRIARDYESKGVHTTFVYSDPDVTEPMARRHAADYGLAEVGAVVTDPTHELFTVRFGATLTPEAAVVVADDFPELHVVYLGRIDDLYLGFGKRRNEPTVRDLRKALDAVLAGKPTPPPGGKAIGCSIPEPRLAQSARPAP
jgi:hypothetical protein